MENEFPSNSHLDKDARKQKAPERVEEKHVQERVARGRVVQRKKPLRKKIAEAFRPEDNKGFVEHVILDILVPGVKDAVADASTSAIENALGVSGSRGRRRSRSGSGGYTSYSSMSDSRPRGRRDRDEDRRDRRPSVRDRVADDAREIIFDTRVDAEDVLDQMIEIMSKYEVVTMRSLLSLAGEPHNPTHEDWGWSDLRGARIHKIREGYLLDLPRPEALD